MDYIALALAPGIAICVFIFYKDVYNREPKLNLIVSFIRVSWAFFLPFYFNRPSI